MSVCTCGHDLCSHEWSTDIWSIRDSTTNCLVSYCGCDFYVEERTDYGRIRQMLEDLAPAAELERWPKAEPVPNVFPLKPVLA